MAKSLAFEITAEDIVAAAESRDFELDLDTAEEIFPTLNAQAIEKAALHGDDLDDQTRYAQEEIASQLEAKGLLQTHAP